MRYCILELMGLCTVICTVRLGDREVVKNAYEGTSVCLSFVYICSDALICLTIYAGIMKRVEEG